MASLTGMAKGCGGAWLLAMGLSLVGGGWLAGGCGQIDAHTFFAAQYDPNADCLGEMVAVDVLSGADPGRCNQVACWINPQTGLAFITEAMCDGPVGWVKYTAGGSNTVCDAALASRIHKGLGTCPADGGTDGGSDSSDEVLIAY